MEITNWHCLMIFLSMVIGIIIHRPILKSAGYGGFSGITAIIVMLSIGKFCFWLSEFMGVTVVNYYLCVCLVVRTLYEFWVMSYIDPVKWEKARKEQEEFEYMRMNEFSSLIEEARNEARIKLNHSVFGRFAWDSFRYY